MSPMTLQRLSRPLLGLVVWSSAACARAPQTAATAPAPQAAPAFPEPRKVTSSPEAIARAREDSVRIPYTDADVHFMTGMISHHAQAIAMAKLAPTHGASSSVRTLAARIINAQTDEIVLMQQWLSDRRKPVPEPRPTGMRMVMNGMEHDMLMPGMLTPEQMKQLDAAQGKEFDRLFLTFMIQHHSGAVAMVKDLFAVPGAGQEDVVFKFASDVNTDQTTEIARMERMLAALTP
jgi:uncharacterized protein (DUF305 family)